MASARQVAANRRNAQKSTGPRTEAGKRRASRNACRHGLAAAIGGSGTFATPIEALAHDIATAATGSALAASDPEILTFARIAAQADRDLARIRGAKTACINALLTAVTGQTTAVSPSAAADLIALPTSDQRLLGCSHAPARSTLLSSEPSHLTEAMRRSVRELSMLSRYERRAIGRRDRAILFIIAQNALLNATKKLQLGASMPWACAITPHSMTDFE
jgi:hypothetical protein